MKHLIMVRIYRIVINMRLFQKIFFSSGSNEQRISQSSAEDNLAKKVKKKDTGKLIDFLRKQDGLFLNEKHFKILYKKEIAGYDFIKIDKQDFKECGLEIGPAMRLADFARELNNQSK